MINTVTDKEVICQYCGYGWEPRVKTPKACPECKRRHPVSQKDLEAFVETIHSKEGMEILTSKPLSLKEKVERTQKLLLRETPLRDVDFEIQDDWRFTKDRPQYADDGNVYRQQALAPHFKRFRTVRVSEDDNETVI